jgi:eukaryotic-like serine/threonine-protein kinase
MSNKIGRFEILSDITHSDLGGVYKASDPEGGKTVALKTLRLESLGELAAGLVKTILEETEAAKVVNSHNVAVLHGTEEIEGILCASMEYVQGNSIATMLARKEGFSIWDLQDIARQSCQGLDHAHAKGIFHHSLEPAKIMVSWDGTVKVLSFGISKMSAFAVQAPGKASEVLHYMSPEQLRGLPVDARSNLFSLGAILYEMVTERKAFAGDDADQVRQAVMENTPVAPDQVNRKIHPALSQVIMKALSKTPEERYASGQDLVIDLERCKESATKGSQAAPKAAKPQQTSAGVGAPAAKAAAPLPAAKAAVAKPMAKAAAAGANADSTAATQHETPEPEAAAASSYGSPESALSTEPGLMSSAATEEPQTETPKIAIDPMMDESRQPGAQGPSFSEIDELPPLKEVYVAPPPPPPAEHEPVEQARPMAAKSSQPEKPKIQPREVAKKAVSEIKKTPPQLFVYSIAGAIVIILLIVAGIAYHIHSEDADDDRAAAPPPATSDSAATTPAPAQPAAAAQTAAPVEATPEPPAEPHPAVSVQPKYKPKKKSKAAPTAPSIVPGTLSVTSTPAGAQIQLDGQSNSSWVTPYDLSGVTPGQHTLVISKNGYSSETRILEVNSNSKSFLSVQLMPLTATVSANSDPAGAEIWIDGKDSGRATPAQIAVDKPGAHSFVFKKDGYLDESTSANLQMGQTTHISPTLRLLGNTDDIRIGGGKLKKMFGGADTTGMGTVSVKTQPRGAQVAVNNRMLDKLAPVDFHLDPGNYVIDITLSGFKSIHRVITVEKNGKIVIDDAMDRQ